MTPRIGSVGPRARFPGAALLLAAVVSPQGLLPLTYDIDGLNGRVEVTVPYTHPTFHMLLAAWNGQTTTVQGVELLANPVVVLTQPKAQDAVYVLPVPATLLAGLGVHLQAAVLDGDLSVSAPVFAAVSGFDPTPFKKGDFDHMKGACAALEMRVERIDARPGTWFIAEYEGRSDGYMLRAAAVVRHADVADVYLTLKTPGPGEGMLDIVQHFRVDVELDDTATLVRVFGVEGPWPYMVSLGAYLPYWQAAMPN